VTKQPTAYSDQMKILKSRGIIVDDEAFCIDILSRLNYYRLTAYMLPFKNSEGSYLPVRFERIYRIYEFDRKLRGILLVALEEVELFLRTKIAYHFAHTYGALGHLDSNNFNKKRNLDGFISEFDKLVHKNREIPFVKHHAENKDGNFPIWVAVELFSFGMLSRFFADLKHRDKRIIAKQFFDTGPEQLQSWILCLSILRNRCAHYMRLYFNDFNKWPKDDKREGRGLDNKIFDYLRILKFCYPDKSKWRGTFFVGLHGLLMEYEDDIDMRQMGFPDNWGDFLESA